MKTATSLRKMIVGGVLVVGVGLGAAACGSSSKPDSPAVQTGHTGSNGSAPASTTPTTAPSGGGVSY